MCSGELDPSAIHIADTQLCWPILAVLMDRCVMERERGTSVVHAKSPMVVLMPHQHLFYRRADIFQTNCGVGGIVQRDVSPGRHCRGRSAALWGEHCGPSHQMTAREVIAHYGVLLCRHESQRYCLGAIDRLDL